MEVLYNLQDTVDIESVLELNPDLIFISKTQEKVYEQLKNIAPTVMIELEQIDWKQDLHKLAEILNKQDVANEWISQYEKNAQQKGEEIKNTYGENTTYLALLASGGQLFVFDAAGIGSILYDDMGLSKPQNLPEQTNISLPVISYEGLSEIDSDYLILVSYYFSISEGNSLTKIFLPMQLYPMLKYGLEGSSITFPFFTERRF